MSAGDGDELRRPFRPRRPEDFDALYAGTPPWDIGRPQPAFLALAEAGQVRGRVLDVGRLYLLCFSDASLASSGPGGSPGTSSGRRPVAGWRSVSLVRRAEADEPATGVEGGACVSPCS